MRQFCTLLIVLVTISLVSCEQTHEQAAKQEAVTQPIVNQDRVHHASRATPNESGFSLRQRKVDGERRGIGGGKYMDLAKEYRTGLQQFSAEAKKVTAELAPVPKEKKEPAFKTPDRRKYMNLAMEYVVEKAEEQKTSRKVVHGHATSQGQTKNAAAAQVRSAAAARARVRNAAKAGNDTMFQGLRRRLDYTRGEETELH